MKRREFLTRVAAGTPMIAGLTAVSAQSPNAAKLARISIMTFNFTSRLKLAGQPASADRPIAPLDLPQMFADTWGVHNIEFQHSHFESTDMSWLTELRARVAKAGSRMTQINVEFGQLTISAAEPVLRDQAIDLSTRWIEHAAVLMCPRVMINQGQLSQTNMATTTAALKRVTEYAKTKNVKISIETREAKPGENAGSRQGTTEWERVKQLVEGAGAFSNIDIGNVMATDQAALHNAIKTLLPSNSGNMHIKLSPNWDLATAIRYTNNDLGYKGLYSIEVDPTLIAGVYNTLLASI